MRQHQIELQKLRLLRSQLKADCRLTSKGLVGHYLIQVRQEEEDVTDSSDEDEPLSRANLALNRGVWRGIGTALGNAPSTLIESFSDLLINPVATIEGMVAGLRNLPELPGLIFNYLETIEGDEETAGAEIAEFITGQLVTMLGPSKARLLTQLSKTKLGAAALQLTNKARKFWKLTQESAVAIRVHEGRYGKIYKGKSDGLWWATDTGAHGGSAFKVFKETPKGLEWMADADRYGQFIGNKHKGPVGVFILWGELSTVK